MRTTPLRLRRRTRSPHVRWLMTLLTLTIAAGCPACTEEQEREDEQPTADKRQKPEQVDVNQLLTQPDVYAGRRVRAESTVQQVISNRGLYVGESKDQRLFVTVLGPKEAMPELAAKQHLRLTGQVAGSQRILNQVGQQLDEQTRQTLKQQDHALVVGANEIQVIEQAPEPKVTQVDFSEVVRQPKTYTDQRVRGETTVREVVGQRGAYLGQTADKRLFTVVRRAGKDVAEVDLKPRQRIRIQGDIMSADKAESKLDDLLTSELRLRLREQSYVMVADPQNVEVLEQPPKVSVMIGDDQYGTFSDWDTDGNQTVARDEFMTNMTEQNVMRDLSEDQNRTLSRKEFQSWLMTSLDRDNNDQISQQEFQAATDPWQDVEWGLFEDWNTDGDEALTASEFNAGLKQVGLYSEWDADGNGELGPDEFGDGLFSVWDRDGDGGLRPREIGFGQPEQPPRQPEARR
ncbi:MAG: hypothetical protein ABEN55_00935 [Bradymonadaceae bacterium]